MKVTELADGQTDSVREPSMVMGESVLKAEMELEVVVGPLTVSVNVEVFVIDPAVAVMVIVGFPVGVVERVLIVRVEEQVGEQAVGENEVVAPDGRPDTANPVD